jgi:hypothetical protein
MKSEFFFANFGGQLNFEMKPDRISGIRPNPYPWHPYQQYCIRVAKSKSDQKGA